MNLKIVIPALLLTHVIAGLGGFFIARSLATDPEHKKGDQKLVQKLADVDAAGQKQERPPEGFAPGEVTFSLVDWGMSRVAFTSDAPLESIVGTTTRVSGNITVSTGDVAGSSAGDISVPVNTLKTGNEKRDEHLLGANWFDAGGHPNIVFKLERVSAADGRLWPGRTIRATIKGTLTIKGIDKAIETTAEVTYLKWNPKLKDFGVKTNLLRVKADFKVTLADFKMEAAVVGQKVADVVVVSLNLTATENAPEK